MINIRKRAYISEIEKESEISKINLLKEYSKIIVKYDVAMQENPKDGKLKYYHKEHYVLDWTKRVGENVVEKYSFDESDNEHAKK